MLLQSKYCTNTAAFLFFNRHVVHHEKELIAHCTFYFCLSTSDKPFTFSANAYVKETDSQKHLGLILDTQLYFEEHLKTVFATVTQTIGLTRQLGTLNQGHLC